MAYYFRTGKTPRIVSERVRPARQTLICISMSKIRIWCDSTCDLSKEQLKQHQITMFPLCVILGDETRLDGVDITPEEIYKWSDAHKTTPKTAAITFGVVEDAIRAAKEADDEVIFIGISSKMSTTNNVMNMAAQEFEYDKLHVFDSRNLSTGIGLQVLRACDYAKQGLSGEEIVRRLEESRGRVRASFCIDTMTYLHRGGRCSAVTALLGAAFMIKPMIAVKDGKMGVAKKYRGKIAKVLKEYAKDLEPELRNAETDRVFVTHTASDETAKEIADYVASLGIFEHVYTTRAGCVISSHCGPGTLGILFYSK